MLPIIRGIIISVDTPQCPDAGHRSSGHRLSDLMDAVIQNRQFEHRRTHLPDGPVLELLRSRESGVPGPTFLKLIE